MRFFLFLGVCFYILISFPPFNTIGAGQGDFYSYWLASKLLIEGVNPYDFNNIQKAASETGSYASRIMLSPIFFSYLGFFGFLPFEEARKLWATGSFIMLAFASRIMLRHFGTGQKPLIIQLSILTVCTFSPIVLNFLLGQMAILLLLASVGLFLHRSSPQANNSIFSLSIVTSLLKPHLFLLLYPLILFQELKHKNFSLFAQVFGMLVLISMVPLLYDHRIYSWYLQTAPAPDLNWKTPTIGSWLLVNFEIQFWIARFSPLTLGIGLIYLMRKKEDNFSFMICLVASLALAPYLWPYDFSLLILPILFVLPRISTAQTCVLLASIVSFWFVPRGEHLNYWPFVLTLYMILAYLLISTKSKLKEISLNPD